MGSGFNGPYANNPHIDVWTLLGSQDTIKEMQWFDRWRREMQFESVEAVIEAYEPNAKLQDMNVWDLINKDYHKWREGKSK
jgi:hypothetical protein